MTITKTYVAFDDTEFDNEDDCLAYEKAVMKSAEAVVFLDGTKQRITEFGDYSCHSMYMLIKKAGEAEELFRWLDEYYGFEWPNDELEDGAMYKWVDDRWINLEKAAKQIADDMECLRRFE